LVIWIYIENIIFISIILLLLILKENKDIKFNKYTDLYIVGGYTVIKCNMIETDKNKTFFLSSYEKEGFFIQFKLKQLLHLILQTFHNFIMTNILR